MPQPPTVKNKSILPVVVGESIFAIPLEKVRYVDNPSKLTHLPLATAPVEGLVTFNNRPLVQINVAQALNLKPKNNHGRIAVVDFACGEVALRVDDVLKFITTQDSSLDKGKPTNSNNIVGDYLGGNHTNEQNIADVPLLQLEQVLPWLNYSVGISNNKPGGEGDLETGKPTTGESHSNVANCYVLLVATDKRKIALFADGVERVETINTNAPLRHTDAKTDSIIRIDNHLFHSRSLSGIFGHQSSSENCALLVRHAQHSWVLLVERVLRLEQINHLHVLISPSGTQSSWYFDDTKGVIEVMEIGEFFGIKNEYKRALATTPYTEDSLQQLSSSLGMEGVRINCGNTTCILPLSLVKRTVDNLGKTVDYKSMRSHPDMIPVVDGTMLLEQHSGAGKLCHMLLTLSGIQHMVLAVDSASLQSLSRGRWMPLVALPSPAAYLFDAAIYDEVVDRWVLRVRAGLDKNSDAWSIRCALTDAILGWLEPGCLDLDLNATG